MEDFGLLVCTFDDGTVAEIVGADTTLGGVQNRMTVFATNAVIEANLNPNNAVRAYAPDARVLDSAYLSEKLETHAGWSQPSPDEDWMQGYPQEMQDFAEAVVHGRPPRADASLGRDVVAVVYGAYIAADVASYTDAISSPQNTDPTARASQQPGAQDSELLLESHAIDFRVYKRRSFRPPSASCATAVSVLNLARQAVAGAGAG